jgi:transcription initiation factor TFIIIB Brf1 subunit/transcription initiation factor TFIIB
MPASIAFADMGLATIIAKHDRDASGHPLNAEMRAIMQRLRKWDLRTHSISPNDRNLTRAFNELNMIKRRTCSIRCGSRGNLRTFIERFSKEG